MNHDDDVKFMKKAIEVSKYSEDPRTKVGAIIVGRMGEIISSGYNKFPNDCDYFPWSRGDGTGGLDTKYPYVVHAEMVALLEATSYSLSNSTIYVTLFPCNECAKMLAHAGIKRVVYRSDMYTDTDAVKAAKIIFDRMTIVYDQLDPSLLETKEVIYDECRIPKQR